MPTTMTLKEAQVAYSLAIDASQVKHGPIFVEHQGTPIAVIISIDDYRRSVGWEEHDAWRQEQLQRQEPNRRAFQRLLPDLLKTHPGQFVAIYQEKLVDADPDRAALLQRIRALGYRSTYVQLVAPEPRLVELDSPEEVWHVAV